MSDTPELPPIDMIVTPARTSASPVAKGEPVDWQKLLYDFAKVAIATATAVAVAWLSQKLGVPIVVPGNP